MCHHPGGGFEPWTVSLCWNWKMFSPNGTCIWNFNRENNSLQYFSLRARCRKMFIFFSIMFFSFPSWAFENITDVHGMLKKEREGDNVMDAGAVEVRRREVGWGQRKKERGEDKEVWKRETDNSESSLYRCPFLPPKFLSYSYELSQLNICYRIWRNW